jgi:hypothetical protein
LKTNHRRTPLFKGSSHVLIRNVEKISTQVGLSGWFCLNIRLANSCPQLQA